MIPASKRSLLRYAALAPAVLALAIAGCGKKEEPKPAAAWPGAKSTLRCGEGIESALNLSRARSQCFGKCGRA